MRQRNNKLDEALALGFGSVKEMKEHKRWLDKLASRHHAAKAFQITREADKTRHAAAATYGMAPEQIVWVEPDEA